MIVALLLNATYVQVIQADKSRGDPRNSRVLMDEYSRQRGQISAAGIVLAQSVAQNDRYKYLRIYPTDPMAFAPVTGFYSMDYSSSGLEKAEDQILNGSDNRLFGQAFAGHAVGPRPPRRQRDHHHQPSDAGGGLQGDDPKGLHRCGGRDRAQHRQIRTLVSTPSFDPNKLATHDGAAAPSTGRRRANDTEAADARSRPLGDLSARAPPSRWCSPRRPCPGVLATPDTQFTAASDITLPGTTPRWRTTR